jgi:putative transcriptional regulator
MAILITLDIMLARRKRSLTELSELTGISIVNLSQLKTGKGRAIRFTTLDRICNALQCQPADLIQQVTEAEYQRLFGKPSFNAESDQT